MNNNYLQLVSYMKNALNPTSPSIIFAQKQDFEMRLVPVPLACEYCGIVSAPDGTGHCPSCGAPVQITSQNQHPSGILVLSGVEQDEVNQAFERALHHAHTQLTRS